MSIEDRNRVIALEARVAKLEQFMAEQREQPVSDSVEDRDAQHLKNVVHAQKVRRG
jgi:hypothetical protein